jgi:pimeloyl-ACP methyl ester carboxylesterase
MTKIGRRWWVLPAILLVLAVAFLLWAGGAAPPMPEALAALHSDADVQVETAPWLSFRPADQEPTFGLILYPGGRVDPRAYAPAARALAEAGHRVVIVPMPLNLAFFASNRAAEVMAAFPEVEGWAIGGHSLGGAMAASYARNNAALVKGLVLWAAYPAGNADLSGSQLATVSIYGTRDGLATPEEIHASHPLLPADTRWVAIEGGNHAQFGWYGAQPGDEEATISREDQQAQVVAATLQLLRQVEALAGGQAGPTGSP